MQDFFVLADQTDGCLKLRWKGVFKLSIGKGSVKLSDLSSGACVVQWQITELRNYGNSSQTVSVHAGSRSSTGEGRFIFRTTESSKIVGCIDREAEVIQMNNQQNAHFSPNDNKVPTLMNPSKLKTSGYVNVNTNPSSTAVPVAVGHNNNFIGQFDNTVENRTSSNSDQRVQVKPTLSNSSSNSTNQKPNKKEQKRLKEEQKRIEKQVKEEQKQREKEEKRAQKERERKRKEFEKQQKKETRHSRRKASHADDPYSEPTDTSLQRHRVLQIPAEDEYAEAGDFPRPSEPKQQIEEKTYLAPWENTPLIPSASQPEERNNVDDIYAAPVKKKITKTKAQSEDSLNMGKDDFFSSEPPPDLVRPTWDREGSSDDMASLYAQTNEVSKVTATDYGHIYGLGSASAEFVPKKENENIYDL